MDKKRSLADALQEPETTRLMGNLISDTGLRKRVLENNFQGGADLEAVAKAKDQAYEIIDKTEEITTFLTEDNSMEYMALLDDDLKKVFGLVGKDGLNRILNNTYLADFALKDRPAFENLVDSIRTFGHLEQDIAEQDRAIRGISERFNVPINALEDIIKTADPRDREKNIKKMVNAVIPTWRLDKRMSVRDHITSAQFAIEDLIRTNENRMKSVGDSLKDIIAGDDEFEERMLDELKGANKPDEKEMTGAEMRKMAETMQGNKTQIEQEVAQAKLKHASMAISRNPNLTVPQDVSDQYWNDLKTSTDPAKEQELRDFQEEFSKAHQDMLPPQTGRRNLLREALNAIFDDLIKSSL